MRDVFRKIWRWLNTPRFGTKAIPRDPHLDLSQLPEHAFPVYCSKCDYYLRGIPDGHCPECGKEFTREKLLVEQYVIGGGVWSRRRSPLSKSLNRTLIALYFGLPAALFGFVFWATREARNPATTNLDALISGAFALMICWVLVIVFSLGVGAWLVVHVLRKRRKRTRVIGAIQDKDADNTPSEVTD